MANICNFGMVILGGAEDCQKFINAIQQIGDVYMGRGASIEEIIKEKLGDNTWRCELQGQCKWSLESSLIANAVSMRTEPEKWAFDTDVSNVRFLTLDECCKEFSVKCEAFSDEPECGIQEHYIIDNGNISVHDTFNYVYGEMYDCKEDAESALGREITDKEWDNPDDMIVNGKFFDWSFSI